MERMTGVEAAFPTVLHALLRRGQGDPALRRAFPACGRPLGEAVATSASLCLFHVFFTFYFFDFSRLFYIGRCLPDSYFLHVFERDTPMDLVI